MLRGLREVFRPPLGGGWKGNLANVEDWQAGTVVRRLPKRPVVPLLSPQTPSFGRARRRVSFSILSCGREVAWMASGAERTRQLSIPANECWVHATGVMLRVKKWGR